MGDNSNDKELVKRAQKGDKVAFDALVTKYQYKVVNLVTRFVKDADTAQDVAQEAFIKAYHGLAKFRGDSAFYTWLYRIAINSAKNYLVSQRRRTPAYTVDIEDAERMESVTSLKELNTPEASMLTSEIENTIYRAIKELPEELKRLDNSSTDPQKLS